MSPSEQLESSVRSYCRTITGIFSKGEGSLLYTRDGQRYIDLLCSCGSMNYGHNEPKINKALIDHIFRNGISNLMDMQTDTKETFISTFDHAILQPRKMHYKLQFTGPTGANAVEASVKLARKYTKRYNVIAFTNAFHGVTQGALSLTGSSDHRRSSAPLLNGVTRVPFDGYMGDHFDTTKLLEKLIKDRSSGVDLPAAIIVEVVQGEGGVNCCSNSWLRSLSHLCNETGCLLIIDEIQTGCGRTGTFFSHEPSGISPDIVILSKSLSASGLPLSLVLHSEQLNVWEPGEHNGTFRGNNYAFVTATKAIEIYWGAEADATEKGIFLREQLIKKRLTDICEEAGFNLRGRGLLVGIDTKNPMAASNIRSSCFTHGVIVELCGPNDEVVKLLPALNIPLDLLEEALNTIVFAIRSHLDQTT